MALPIVERTARTTQGEKVMLQQFKMYFIIAAILGAGAGCWSARGWYEDGKIVEALETQKKEYEKQAEKDAKSLTAALTEQESLRNAYEGIKYEANKVKLCTNGGVDFLRLFNRGAVAANPKK